MIPLDNISAIAVIVLLIGFTVLGILLWMLPLDEVNEFPFDKSEEDNAENT